ncbi:MAG: hypothetical protein V1908_04725 [Candidatus Peregrinibacteria bacterium]
MLQMLLFIGLTVFIVSGISALARVKKVHMGTLLGLFALGMAFSTPFLLVEHWGEHFKFYVVIIAFLTIEFSLLVLEHHVKFLHDLIHHNVRHLRIVSFIVIGVGFTYTEVAYALLNHVAGEGGLATQLIFRTTFGVFIHTVLTSLSSLSSAGAALAENALEEVFRFLNYYGRIAFLSFAHYLYIFFSEKNSLFILPFITFNLVCFFWAKRYLDKKRGALPS